uniref:Structurally designed HMPV F protein HMPV_v3B_D12_DS454,Fibritin n=1 Tax=Enterobacteria phage T2 TaxID=2060721 RepID=UPI0026F37D76|nr:Chain A, Structurally designed HMPV F protein HMPV_v3B_D12_DS454,Fibritin [synthetic construct]8F6X_B Chain B, Structurally designed HMPV F protein HMPV_v3B_D12_DS454,Fibritin [synthetic construct]8F6X_C Chain C, Structurally designed HMPV F protein HMPV_v3B_D12_DS454,Fibritin [synthetic construct]
MSWKVMIIISLLITPQHGLKESYLEESCSTITEGYLSVLRTGWYTNVFTLEVGDVENLTCTDGPSLIKTELDLTKSALRELKTCSADQGSGGSGATAAAVTAGIAIAKTIRLESEVNAIKGCLKTTNECVSTLGNGVRVLATAVRELKEFVSKNLTSAINKNKCDIPDLKMAVSFSQFNRRFLNVVRQFSDNAGITPAISLDLMTDAELARAVSYMPTSAGQIKLMLENRCMVRRKGFGILIGVYGSSVIYMVQLPIFGVIDTPCWIIKAAPSCSEKDGNYACLLREDQGWYCKNAGSTVYYPNDKDCETRGDHVFCDTAAGINVAEQSRECNINISTTNYPCKVSTGRHPISMVALSPLGALVACYKGVSCSIGSNRVGIIKQLPKGCSYITNQDADTVTIDNTVYQLSKVEGEQHVIKGRPVSSSFDPIKFPECQFNCALDQVFESIENSQALVDQSNKILNSAESAIGGYIPEAPRDGQAYVRKDGEWVLLSTFLGGLVPRGSHHHHHHSAWSHPQFEK